MAEFRSIYKGIGYKVPGAGVIKAENHTINTNDERAINYLRNSSDYGSSLIEITAQTRPAEDPVPSTGSSKAVSMGVDITPCGKVWTNPATLSKHTQSCKACKAKLEAAASAKAAESEE